MQDGKEASPRIIHLQRCCPVHVRTFGGFSVILRTRTFPFFACQLCTFVLSCKSLAGRSGLETLAWHSKI